MTRASQVYAEAAARLAPLATNYQQDERYALAALIPHPHTPGRGDCKACGMGPDAAIHQWDQLGDEQRTAAA